MIRGAIALALLFAAATAWAQAPGGQPLVRTKLIPAEGVVIGQPVRLDVEVLFPGDMSYPPLASVPEAKGAQIMRFETQAVTIRERVDGQDYVGQNFEFILFPRRGGEIAVPAPHVTLLDRSGDPAGTAEGQPTRLGVTVPAGIDPSGPVLVADAVTRLHGDATLAPLLAGLEQALFGAGGSWGREQGNVLAHALARWRSQPPASAARAGPLPALNPVAGQPPL